MTEPDGDAPDGVHVLLAEDNPGDVRLTQEGFDASPIDTTVHVVTDGDATLDFVYRRGEYADAPRPDLVVLDLNLPCTNGDDVLADLKADPELRRVPVVVFTSSQARDDLLTAYDHHANACLSKPVDPTEYIEMVSRIGELWFSIVQLPTIHE